MKVRRSLALAVAGLLGAAVAVLPAVASSETAPSIEAENTPSNEHHWKPATATVAEGATIAISNHTEVPHGVEWRSGPEAPKCDKTVPVGTSGIDWSGTCTFSKPGVYVFWCTVHTYYMTATVTVQPATTTTGTTGTEPGSTTGPSGGGGGGTSTSPPVSPPASSPTSPLASAASTAVKVRSHQRGRAVRGSVEVSSAGAGSRLEVELLKKRASSASSRSAFTRLGRFVRAAVGSGTVTFKVPLSTSGRRALARAGRLALTVEIKLTPRSGAAVVVERSVLLRA
jgi:plastocyanin